MLVGTRLTCGGGLTDDGTGEGPLAKSAQKYCYVAMSCIVLIKLNTIEGGEKFFIEVFDNLSADP